MSGAETKYTSEQAPLITPEIVFAESTERPYPKIKLLNTRVFLTTMEEKYHYKNLKGHEIMLTELPDEEWNKLLEGDFEYLYIMGIYEPSEKGREIALDYKDQYLSSLPDMTDDDVVASPFAIGEYKPAKNIANSWEDWDENVLKRLHRSSERGVKVVIDWILYDAADDSPILSEHPDYFIQASEQVVEKLSDSKKQFQKVRIKGKLLEIVDKEEPGIKRDGELLEIAHAGEPGGIPWIDNVQLALYKKAVLDFKLKQAIELSQHCDGLRIDMAKLGFPWVIEQKWGWLMKEEEKAELYKNPPWPYVMSGLLAEKPNLVTIAELYDDGEIDAAVRAGIKSSYDEKTLLKFREIYAGRQRVTDGLAAHLRYLAEFLDDHQLVEYSENHDIPRTYTDFGEDFSIVIATVNALTPRTMWMVQEGQQTGSKVKLPMQLKRAPNEVPNRELEEIYQRLYKIRNSEIFQKGTHHIIDTMPCVPENDSYKDVVVQQAELEGNIGMYTCSNTGKWRSECKIPIPKGVKEIKVYDMKKGTWLPEEEIAKVDIEGNIFIGLDPLQVQIIYYSF